MAEPQSRTFAAGALSRGFGGGNHAHDPLSPYGMENTSHAWLHSRCWPAQYAGRKAEAVAALAAMGIAAPADLPNDFGKKDALLWVPAGGHGHPVKHLGLASRCAGLWVVRASIPTPRTNG
ncbi:MAG: hypothetical protein WA231_24800, partial [Methylocella sp.]